MSWKVSWGFPSEMYKLSAQDVSESEDLNWEREHGHQALGKKERAPYRSVGCFPQATDGGFIAIIAIYNQVWKKNHINTVGKLVVD